MDGLFAIGFIYRRPCLLDQATADSVIFNQPAFLRPMTFFDRRAEVIGYAHYGTVQRIRWVIPSSDTCPIRPGHARRLDRV